MFKNYLLVALRNLYRVSISWWFFLIPLILVLLITMLTVSSLVLKTANVTPAESLRSE